MSEPKPGQHVMPSLRGGWSVFTSGASRASRIFASKDEAIAAARERAERDGSILYVHGANWQIEQRQSFIPEPAKG